MAERPSAFDVMKAMAEANSRALSIAPLKNIIRARQVKGETQITIGVEGNLIEGLLMQRYVGGLLLIEKDEFHRFEREVDRG